jgi:poly(3-hydroxybutyrate) depolymerase
MGAGCGTVGAYALRILLLTMLLCAAGANGAEGKLQTAELGRCVLENGQEIRDCQVSYRLYGKRNATGSNVVLMPSWYNGSAQDLARYGYLGESGIVDTRDYQVIAVNAFGNGISSSPSNSDQNPFPEFTIRDIVSAQHRLLTEVLKLEHVHAIVGASMGGHQVYEWMLMYPQFASHFVPIEGSPWPTFYDYVKERGWIAALESPLDSQEEIARVNQVISAFDTLLYWTPQYVNREMGQGDFESLFDARQRPYSKDKLLDRASQTRALLSHDIRRGRDDFDQRLQALSKVSAMAVVFEDDMTVIPGPSLELAQKLGFEAISISGDCGHFGPNPECYQGDVSRHVREFLALGNRHSLLRRSMNLDGADREYFVYVPDGYGDIPLPVVMGLHGFGSTATGFATIYDLNAHAKENGYIFVYPQGSNFQGALGDDPSADPYLISSWNDEASNFTPTEAGPHCTDDRLQYPCPPECGSCNHCAWTSCYDDSTFLLKVLDEVAREFNTDSSRYYLLGNSNGGGMAMRLGCDHPQRFAAIGVSIYQMPPGHTCGPDEGLPMLHVYGEKDDGVGHDGTPTSYGWIYASAAENTRDWARAMDCQGEPETWRNAITDANGLVCNAYTDCPQNDQEVASCMDPEAGHEWRGQRITQISNSCVTPAQQDSLPGQPLCPQKQATESLWGMDLFWQFFERYQRMP